jgi:hypothetical protein
VNDNFADALEVVIANDGDTYTSDPIYNAEATTESGEPSLNSSSEKSCWWKYTPAADGTVTIDTESSYGGTTPGSYDDLRLSVYTGTWGSLTRVASDASDPKIIELAVTAGTTYFLQVGSQWGDLATYIPKFTGPATAGAAAPLVALSAVLAASSGLVATLKVASGLGGALSGSAALSANLVVPANAGVLAASLTAASALAGSLHVRGPLAASMTATAVLSPALTVKGRVSLAAGLSGQASLLGNLTAIAVTDSSDMFANDGYNYTGTSRVFYEAPIAEPPPAIVREKVKRVHQSLPAPTVVNGRPTW